MEQDESGCSQVRSSKDFRTRVIFCASIQLNMFLISMFCNIIGITELDDLYLPSAILPSRSMV